MNEQLEQLMERRHEIMFALIEADSDTYRELEIELEEIEAEIEALGGETEEEEEY